MVNSTNRLIIPFAVLVVVGVAMGVAAMAVRRRDTPPPTPALPAPTPSAATTSPEQPTPIDVLMPTPTGTLTPQPTATNTPAATEPPTVTPLPSPTEPFTATPTATVVVAPPSPTASATAPPAPLVSPEPPMPLLPPDTCVEGRQQIRAPLDGTRMDAGRESLEIIGDAYADDFDKYQIDLTYPDNSFHPKEQFFEPVQAGLLYRWPFEPEQDDGGGGWYIIRLLVIDSVGNYAMLGADGQNYGCHVRVYLPPPN